jgi:hypothetical protein
LITSFQKLHLKVTGLGSYARHKALNEISGREIVSTAEMTDLLLDIRLHIMLDQELTTPTYQ